MNTNTNTLNDIDLEYVKKELSQAILGNSNNNALNTLNQYYNKKNPIMNINEPLPDCGTWTPLATSVYLGKTQEVEFLLKNGADANHNIDGSSIPLHLAILNGKFNIVKYLIKYGADANKKTEAGQTGIMIACEQGQTEILQYLIDNIDTLKLNVMEIDNNNKTCLDFALEKGNFQEIRMIEYYKLKKMIPQKSSDSGTRKTKI